MAEQHRAAGKARLLKITPQRRSEIAAEAARTRWERSDPERVSLPRAAFGALDRPLRIGDMQIPCFVLEDERRVLTGTGMQDALGLARGGSMVAGLSRLELFAAGARINPFIASHLKERVHSPILFLTPTGQKAYGYEAEVLVELCEAVLSARAAGKLQTQQLPIGQQCELVMRGLARVGIVALVDEVTGYQEVRQRDALHKILEAYISPELMPWTKRFPNSFYKEMFRLHGWPYDPASVKRPGVVGKFTTTYIYEQLPDGVLDELKRVNPKGETGRRRAALHQFLTDGVGHPHLERQIAATTAIMRVADDWPMFKKMFQKAYPAVIDHE